MGAQPSPKSALDPVMEGEMGRRAGDARAEQPDLHGAGRVDPDELEVAPILPHPRTDQGEHALDLAVEFRARRG